MRNLFAPLFAALLLLAACGGSEPTTPPQANAQSDAVPSGKLNSWGRDLVKEGNCHPAIALALQPYEADYGQCRMNTYDDVCGQGNFKKGVALISMTFEQEIEMANPWGIACARSGNVENALTAGCMSRFNQSEDACRCAARKTIENERAELSELLSYTDNADMITALEKYPEYLGVLGAKSPSDMTKERVEKQDEFQTVFQRHYTRFEKECL